MTEYLELRESVLAANLALPAHGLIKLTWGNVSEIDRDLGVIAIKPSGVSYGDLTAADIVVLDLAGNVIDGEQSPSTDTPTHVALYQAFEEIGAVVHTHSTWATVFAQAQRRTDPRHASADRGGDRGRLRAPHRHDSDRGDRQVRS
jgi:L-ribulose-5-phosphate 4-epimerase